MKKIDQFYKLITDGLITLGAVEMPNESYRWSINTKYDELKINIHDNDTTMNVYTQFKNPERSKHLFNCNPYSGKWNFHMGDIRGKDITIYAEKIINTIKNILP